MQVHSESSLADMLDNLVHGETQLQDGSAILTVATVERVEGGAQLDFGGGEYSSADKQELEPEKRDPDDDYGWWELDEGMYVVSFNESIHLPEGKIGVVQPWWKSFMNGLNHPTQVITGDHDEFHMLFHVEEPVSIKENARTTELKVLQ